LAWESLGGQLELDDLWERHGERIARNARVLWDDLLSVEAITSAARGPRT
jgi:hypothetical protein